VRDAYAVVCKLTDLLLIQHAAMRKPAVILVPPHLPAPQPRTLYVFRLLFDCLFVCLFSLLCFSIVVFVLCVFFWVEGGRAGFFP
jgi:hypothetical protein